MAAPPSSSSSPSATSAPSAFNSASSSAARSEIPDPKSEIEPPQSELEEDVYSLPGLPDLTEIARRFITAFINNSYNLTAAAQVADLSPEDIYLFTADADIQAHIEAHFKFQHLATKCRATQARKTVIEATESLLQESDDPVEKRKLATILLRATSAPLIPLPRQGGVAEVLRRSNMGSESSSSSSSSSLDALMPHASVPSSPPRIRPDYFKPDATDNSKKTFLHLLFALQQNDRSGADTGVRTISEFLEHEAEINSKPITTDNTEDCFKAVLESPVANLRSLRRAWNYQAQNLSETHEVHSATVSTRHGDLKVTMELTKASPADSLSRDPGRWLIKKITTSPGDARPPNEKFFDRVLVSPFDTC